MTYVSASSNKKITLPKKSSCCDTDIVAVIEEWDEIGKPTDFIFECQGCTELDPGEDFAGLSRLVYDNVRIVKRTPEQDRDLFNRWVEGKGLPG